RRVADAAQSRRSHAGRLSIAAGSRRLDDHRLVGVDDGSVGAFEFFHSSVVAPYRVLAHLTRFAARQAERAYPAVAGQDRAVHLFQKTDGAANAVAGVPLAAPAGAFADMEILEHHRIAELEHLRIGEAGIGHVGVHGIGTWEARTRGGARADGLVVLVCGVAEVEVV